MNTLRAVALLLGVQFSVALAQPAQPTLLEPVTVAIEHPANKGSGRILLRNQTAASINNLSLRVGNFVSKFPSNGAIPLGAKATISWTDDAGKPLAAVPTTIAADQTVVANVDVTDLWESGESTATLYNGGSAIGTITAVKYRVPFAIRLDVPTPDKPELSFSKGQPAQVVLKNDDPVTYYVIWELVVGDRLLTGPKVPQALSPNGLLRIQIAPDNAWFPRTLKGLFQADSESSRLLLYFVPPPGSAGPQWPVKNLPFQANLFSYSETTRAAGGVIFLFVVLFAGGLVSIWLNNGIPNAFQLLDLKDRLTSVARQARGLSDMIEVRKRTMFTTEQQRLQELLGSRSALSPDFQTVAGDVRLSTDLLDVRLDRLAKIDALYQRLRTMASSQSPPAPTRVDEIATSLRGCADTATFVMPSQQDLKDIRQSQFLKDCDASLNEADQRITALAGADPQFEAKLKDRLANLRLAFGNPAMDSPPLAVIRAALPGLFTQLMQAPQDFRVGEYTNLDTIAFKMECIADYLSARVASTFSPQKLQQIDADFIARLGPLSWEQLSRARTLVLELKQGFLPEDIADAVRNPEFDLAIDASPSSTRPNVPVAFRARFYGRDDLTQSAASDKIKCFWDFGDDLRAQGWQVDHFYRRAPVSTPIRHWITGQTFTVKATFVDAHGDKIMLPDGKTPKELMRTVKVKPRLIWLASRTRLETVWLLAGLAIPFFSLLTGAREQFMKVDVVTGMVTVFLLGFGADHVKNLFKKAS